MEVGIWIKFAYKHFILCFLCVPVSRFLSWLCSMNLMFETRKIVFTFMSETIPDRARDLQFVVLTRYTQGQPIQSGVDANDDEVETICSDLPERGQ